MFSCRYIAISACVLLVSGCGQASNQFESLQAKILDDVVNQGGSSLKSVICPDSAQDENMTCIGVLESGSGFDIAVETNPDKTYSWKIQSIKGLLNMEQLRSAIQAELPPKLAEATIDCGTTLTYKAAKPGEQFDCLINAVNSKATAKTAKEPNKSPTGTNKKPKNKSDAKPGAQEQPEKITVTILPSGDINWQTVASSKLADGSQSSNKAGAGKPQSNVSLPSPEASKLPPAQLPADPPESSPIKANQAGPVEAEKVTPEKSQASETSSSTAASKPAQSAEEALNAADALDGWDD